MVAAFFDSLSRRVRTVQPDGTVETVQALPRGGWFKRLYVNATEYDMRLLRAALANAPDSCFPHGRSHQRVATLPGIQAYRSQCFRFSKKNNKNSPLSIFQQLVTPHY